MLKGSIICPDQDLTHSLEGMLQDSRRVGIVRKLASYPNVVDLVRFLRASAPELIFLSVESRQHAAAVAERIHTEAPGVQIVAVGRSSEPADLLEMMRVGVREFLAMPFDRHKVWDCLVRVSELIESRPPNYGATDSVFAFLPSKAGVGCSTIAVNTAIALAQLPDTPVLLADFDLNCGMVGFMLQVEHEHSVTDATDNAFEMDEDLWPKLVWTSGRLAVLTSGKFRPGYRIDPNQVHHMIDFARRHYKVICVDLSGMMEKYSLELLQEAKKIFLVCTPEIPSLHLTREKLAFLKGLELESRTAILLNRAHKRNIVSLAEIEKLFGLPVHMTFPNDYMGVHEALTSGKNVSSSSELGQRYRELARSMTSTQKTSPEAKKGLLETLLPRRRPELADGIPVAR